MLRCRPYDICFVVSAHPALEDAIIDVQQGGSTVWALEHPLRVTLKQDVMHRGRFWPNGGTVSLLTIYDDWLRPLRDSDAPDEMLMIAGLPATIGGNTALNDAAHSSLALGQCSLPRPIGESLAAASLFFVACRVATALAFDMRRAQRPGTQMTDAKDSQPSGLASMEGLGLVPKREELCQPEGLRFDAFGEPRTRYARVTLGGSHCVMHPSEGDCYVQDARDAGDPDWERYVVRDVWLSEREFEDLPEHDGF